MLKGQIKIYRFTIKSSNDSVELTGKLNDIFYKKQSSIELFHISKKEGKLVISFTQNQENFISVMNPDNDVIYTSATNKHSYEDFINEIYDNDKMVIKNYVLNVNCAHGKGIKFIREELKFFAKTN
jgi:hypothetical protein